MSREPSVSVVVPFYNERDNVAELHAQIAAAMERAGVPWEAVYVDDGSEDGTLPARLEARRSDPARVTVIRLRRNFGQTAAMAAGFKQLRADVIVRSATTGEPNTIANGLSRCCHPSETRGGPKTRVSLRRVDAASIRIS